MDNVTPIKRRCDYCGSRFVPKSANHKFCSEECRAGGPHVMRRRVEKSVDTMHWLTDADEALVAVAIAYADEIDEAKKAARNDPKKREAATKAVFMLGPYLANTLKALGGSPGDRKALDVVQKKGKSALASVRRLRETSGA